MAARLNPSHDARTRAKIQTSQLINRLEGFVLGGSDPKTKKPIEMTSPQVTAALGLLKKTLPDLSVTEHQGEVSITELGRYLMELSDRNRGVPKSNGHDHTNGQTGS